LLSEAKGYYQREQFDESLNSIMKGLKFAPTASENGEYNRLAACIFLNRGKLIQARLHAEAARRHAARSGNLKLIYTTAFTLGNVFSRMNNYSLASQVWRQALKQAEQNNDTRIQGRLYLNLALLDQRRGNHKSALEKLKVAMQKMKVANDKIGEATCYSRMSFYYTEMEDYENALIALKSLEKISAEIGNKNLEAVVHFRRASVHLKKEEFAKAIPELHKSIKLYTILKDNKNAAMAKCDLIRAYIYLGRTEQADEFLEDTIEFIDATGHEACTGALKLVMAEKELIESNATQAILYYKEALDIAESLKDAYRFRAFHESFLAASNRALVDKNVFKELLHTARLGYARFGLDKQLAEIQEWLEKTPR